MKVLYDTNVFLDLYLRREEFVEFSSIAIDKAGKNVVNGFASAVSITTIYYTIEKFRGRHTAEEAIKDLLSIIKIAPVGEKQIFDAANSEHSDFEDAVICQSAIDAGVDCIVTRDKKGFKHARGLRVLSPAEFVAMF
jgi:predicted nucleic acid-binding protein